MTLYKPVFVHLVISCSKTGCETSCLFWMTMCRTKNQEFYYLRWRKWILWVSATVSKISFALSILLYPSLIYFNTPSPPQSPDLHIKAEENYRSSEWKSKRQMSASPASIEDAFQGTIFDANKVPQRMRKDGRLGGGGRIWPVTYIR